MKLVLEFDITDARQPLAVLANLGEAKRILHSLRLVCSCGQEHASATPLPRGRGGEAAEFCVAHLAHEEVKAPS
jgi:hypothetical protein